MSFLSKAKEYIKLASTLERVSKGLALMGACALAGMVLIISADVVSRTFFDKPIQMTCDLTELLLVIVIFLGLPYTTFLKEHVRVEFFVHMISSQRILTLIQIITGFLGIGLLALLVRATTEDAIYSFKIRELTLVAMFPISPFKFLIVVGLFLVCLVLLTQVIDFLNKIKSSEGI